MPAASSSSASSYPKKPPLGDQPTMDPNAKEMKDDKDMKPLEVRDTIFG